MSLTRARRVKRDSVQNLYNQCQLTGNCLPDVKNKVEGTTLADKLLKIFSSIIYLGGLSIGTGKGTGGSTGYTPLGGTTGGGRVGTGGTVVRPNVVVEPLGPTDIVPVDTLNPNSSSIVPLLEAGPDIIISESAPGPTVNLPDAGTDLGISELDIVTTSDPVSDVTIGNAGGPTVSTSEDSVAIIDVQPASSTPRRVATSTYNNPSYVTVYSQSTLAEETSANINVFVDSAFGGDVIGSSGQDIPLETFNVSSDLAEFEIEEPPRTSTPRDTIERALQRARDLYQRRVQQVRTRNVDFLGRPQMAVQFQFENPAFEDDITLTFEQDLNQLATAAPDADFADVIRLHRPRYSVTDAGTVRVSRLGQRGTIHTRSGLQIGQQVHFYYDISDIEPAEAIELTLLGEHSGEAAVVNAQSESTVVDAENSNSPFLYPEEELIDVPTEDFSDSHLVLSSNSRRSYITTPTLPPGTALRVFIDDYANGLFVSYPETYNPPQIIVPAENLPPTVLIDSFNSNDFILHPSHNKRRKRKRGDV
uniref:Minor capsid protein L2 n=1 Tax=Human papillomavirus TaxID=10566 RepID=A0A385PL71_9PAPI|nr:MAG: L2 protein [Human papillomavirus]